MPWQYEGGVRIWREDYEPPFRNPWTKGGYQHGRDDKFERLPENSQIKSIRKEGERLVEEAMNKMVRGNELIARGKQFDWLKKTQDWVTAVSAGSQPASLTAVPA